jgi:hypothetical protein
MSQFKSVRIGEVRRALVACAAQIPIGSRSGGGYSIDKPPARRSCWNDGSGGRAGVAVAGLSHCGDFQTKGAANRGEPLSAAAVGCARAQASAASFERRRSALLGPGKPMAQRLASSVADCETGNSSGLAASGLDGVLEGGDPPTKQEVAARDPGRASPFAKHCGVARVCPGRNQGRRQAVDG